MRRETKAQKAERVKRILELLDQEYGTEYRCYLNHETPWQLLIAVIMSAQCTDARVNIVTETLFKKSTTRWRSLPPPIRGSWSRISTPSAFTIPRRRISLPAVRRWWSGLAARFRNGWRIC